MILILIFVVLVVVLFLQTNGSMEPSIMRSMSQLLSYFSSGINEVEQTIEQEVRSIETEFSPKEEVEELFHVPNQTFTYNEAKLFCKSIGVRLATLNEVKTSYLEGAQWYNMGWTDGQLGLYVLQPRFVRRYPSAGTIGVNGGYFRNTNLRMGVNCYGVKPKPDPARIEFSYNELKKELDGDDGTQGESQRLQQKYKEMLKDGEIVVSPWNDRKWSIDSKKRSKYHIFPETGGGGRGPGGGGRGPGGGGRGPGGGGRGPGGGGGYHPLPPIPPSPPSPKPHKDNKPNFTDDDNISYSEAVSNISKSYISNALSK